MPLYDYRCESGHIHEVLCRMDDDTTVPCPECGKSSLRQISAPGKAKVRGGRRRKDIQYRKPGETINLKRDSGDN